MKTAVLTARIPETPKAILRRDFADDMVFPMKKRGAIAIGFSALARILFMSPAFLPAGFASAQTPAVNVTITADDPVLIPGQTTTVRVFAQVDALIEPDAEGIFSWYIDVLNSDGTVAVADYDNLTMSSSDNFPETSGSGTTDGAHRRGINNTFFLSNPEAGKGSPVELLAVQLTASQLGVTTLSVAAGTTVPSSAGDFLVEPIVTGPLLTGGNYTAASVVVKVVPVSEAIQLGISRDAGGVVELDFTPIDGFDHTVMFSDDMSPGSWLPLPGDHNSGVATDLTVGVPRRFYRLLVEKQ